MKDLEEFKQKNEEEAAEESKNGEGYDPLKNVGIIEEIMQDQTKYSAYVDTLFLADE